MSHVKQKNFEFSHGIGDEVMVDGDASFRMVVTSIQVFPEGIVYKLSWFNDNGASVDQVFDDFRIEAYPPSIPSRRYHNKTI